MNSKKLVKILSDPRCGNAFGTVSGIKSMRARLSEENLCPTYSEAVKPEEAARMMIYCVICPSVSAPAANGIIQTFEAQFKRGVEGQDRDFESTSLGYLTAILSGDCDAPYQLSIDREYGSITVSELMKDTVFPIAVDDDAEFWPGRFDNMPVETNWPKSPVIIKGAWLKELGELVRAGVKEMSLVA